MWWWGDDAKLEPTPATVGPCPDNDVMNASLFSFCRVLLKGGVGEWGEGSPAWGGPGVLPCHRTGQPRTEGLSSNQARL